MSGLEVFLDGGATFASLLSAGAAVVGYRQQKEDDLELVEDVEEVEQLRKNLSEAATSACAAHALGDTFAVKPVHAMAAMKAATSFSQAGGLFC